MQEEGADFLEGHAVTFASAFLSNFPPALSYLPGGPIISFLISTTFPSMMSDAAISDKR